MIKPKDVITGVILAGGRGRRMQEQDKGLIKFQGKPLIEHSITRLEPQTRTLLINANRNIERYRAYGYPVLTDTLEGYPGPLAGVLSALMVIKTEYLLTAPCDCPLFPQTLALHMFAILEQAGAEVCVASDGRRLQPVFLLLHCDLAWDLADYLERGGRKIDTWLGQRRLAEADFSDQSQAFLNINTPGDMAELESQREEKI